MKPVWCKRISFKKNSFEKTKESYEPQNNNEDIKSNLEMPPQRDVRDVQPTISVNYRVVKNTEKNNLKGRRGEQQEVLLGEAFPPAYSAGSGSSSPKEMISRVDDSGTTRAPLPFFRTFG